MKQNNIMPLIIIAVASIVGRANAETCLKTTYNVVYSCGAGTESGTLPDGGIAHYKTSFTPAALTSACTAPSGYKISGWSAYTDGVERVYTTSSFYGFTSDVVIQPHYVSDSSGEIATSAELVANLGLRSISTKYVSGASGTWQVVFPYGTVNGVSKCTTIKPENTADGTDTGLIADYDAIEGASAGGRYCYCKMTEPYIAASPWVFYEDFEAKSLCVNDCAYRCKFYLDYHSRFQASVFAGAIAEYFGN